MLVRTESLSLNFSFKTLEKQFSFSFYLQIKNKYILALCQAFLCQRSGHSFVTVVKALIGRNNLPEPRCFWQQTNRWISFALSPKAQHLGDVRLPQTRRRQRVLWHPDFNLYICCVSLLINREHLLVQQREGWGGAEPKNEETDPELGPPFSDRPPLPADRWVGQKFLTVHCCNQIWCRISTPMLCHPVCGIQHVQASHIFFDCNFV